MNRLERLDVPALEFVSSIFNDYLRDMTTRCSEFSHISPYGFWRERFTGIDMYSVLRCSKNQNEIASLLLRLCTAFLFGNGEAFYIPMKLILFQPI